MYDSEYDILLTTTHYRMYVFEAISEDKQLIRLWSYYWGARDSQLDVQKEQSADVGWH